VVFTIVQVVLIDYACVPRDGVNNYLFVVGIGILYAVSLLLERWANVCQTRYRGRTGGVRQQHRIALFSKMLFLDHEEHCQFNSSHWLYGALVDVDNMTMQGYWQAFMMCENLFALLLTLVLIFGSAVLKSLRSGEQLRSANFLPTLGVLVIVPITLGLIWRRRKRTERELMERANLESEWVDTLAWLARQGDSIFSLGMRDLARIERNFEAESKKFVTHHQAARDLQNDSVWVTEWIAQVTALMAMLWGSYVLLKSNADRDNLTTAGDLVLLLKVYSKFGKYLVRVNQNFIQLQRSAVSTQRVADLLNLPEHTMLRRTAQDKSNVELQHDPRREQKLVLQDVLLSIPAQQLELEMHSGIKCEIHLGVVVRVRSGAASDSTRAAFLKLLAGVLGPTRGSVDCTSTGPRIMLPENPAGVPHSTVLSSLALGGVTSYSARRRLAAALELEPERKYDNLTLGERKRLELLRVLLRDPEILVLDCPFGLIRGHMRKRLQSMLRAWQSGGGSLCLIQRALGDSKMADVSTMTKGRTLKRTLIITEDDMDGQPAGSDTFIDLDTLLKHPTDLSNIKEESRGPVHSVS